MNGKICVTTWIWLVTLRLLLVQLRDPQQLFNMEQHPLAPCLSGMFIQETAKCACVCQEGPRKWRGGEGDREVQTTL